VDEPQRESLDPQDFPDPGEGIGLRSRTALAGYGILSMILAVIGFVGLEVPGLLNPDLSLPAPLGWIVQAGDLWGVISALAVVSGLLGIAQTIQEERRGLSIAILGFLLGAWGLLAFLSRLGWLQLL